MSPGHVFVLLGDLTRLSCDHWLLPTDGDLRVTGEWRAALGRLGLTLHDREPDADWRAGRTRAMRAHVTSGRGDRPPQAWYVNVAAHPGNVAAHVDAARAFLDAVSGDDAPPRHDRERRLVALPLVGTGLGGSADHAGEVVAQLLPVLRDGAARGLDVALVILDPAAFAAAQRARGEHAWPELDRDLVGHARRLADLAARRRLVVFAGAGVSMASGAPAWKQLIRSLAADAGFSADEVGRLLGYPAPDAASIIERRLADLIDRVIRLCDAPFPALAHAYLAALPVDEYVTTNYDRLLEAAAEGVKQPLSVLPWSPGSGGRWLLKMHGCVDHPQEIVLTREHYLRYDRNRGALAGIVQSLLITRHMLFLGFSLADENFHRVVDAVRVALGAGAGNFGTALMLDRDTMLEELWGPSLKLASLGSPRRLEIFLDWLLAHALPTTRHLLDDRFASVLSDGERELRRALERLLAVSPAARAAPAWAEVEKLLARLGRGA